MEPTEAGICEPRSGEGGFPQGSWESGERDKGKHGMIKRSTIIFLALVIILCLGAIAIEAQTMIRRTIDDVLYDNRNHYLPCEQLPTELEVRKVVAEHQDVIQQMEQVNPGLVGVEIDTSTCPGKADLLIWYASHQNRLDIEEIIAGETFYGVPYRLQNR
jgi:hypothetical protein